MESLTYIKNIRISAKKLRFMATDIRKRNPVDVLHNLNYMPKRGARLFYKAIKSAIANAKLKLKASDDLLRFKLLTIEQGQKLKRYRAGGRGTAKPFQRQTAHIKIILIADKPAEKVAEKVVEKAKPKVKDSKKSATAKATADKK